jgi:hypothetical protein
MAIEYRDNCHRCRVCTVLSQCPMCDNWFCDDCEHKCRVDTTTTLHMVGGTITPMVERWGMTNPPKLLPPLGTCNICGATGDCDCPEWSGGIPAQGERAILPTRRPVPENEWTIGPHRPWDTEWCLIAAMIPVAAAVWYVVPMILEAI